MTSTYTTPAEQRIQDEIRHLQYFVGELINTHAPEMLDKARTADTARGRTYWAAGVVQWRGVLWNAMSKLTDLDGMEDGQRAEWVGILDSMVSTAARIAGMTPEALEELDPTTLPKP